MRNGMDYFDLHDPHHSMEEITEVPPVPNCLDISSMDNNTSNSYEDGIELTNFSIEEQSNNNSGSSFSKAINLQRQLGFDLEQQFNNSLIQDVIQDSQTQLEQAGWSNDAQSLNSFNQEHQFQNQHLENYPHQMAMNSNSTQVGNLSYTPDLLNLIQLPKCPMDPLLPTSNPTNYQSLLDIFEEIQQVEIGSNPVLCDAPLHLNFTPQTPLFRDLFHNLPHNNYNLPVSRDGTCLFRGEDDRGGIGGVFQEADVKLFEDSLLDFRREPQAFGKGQRGNQHFATERQRREQFNEKYSALKALVPNPTKSDRASIVGDAIEYINELKRTVKELTVLVDQKRDGKPMSKKVKVEEGGAVDLENSSMKPTTDNLAEHDRNSNGSLRCSWLTRRSKETIVDVRIIDDEVYVKLTQRKKPNCLLFVSKILEELRLQLLHVTGGHIGDSYIFMFNTKICDGSTLYASAIASKVFEVADRQYTTLPTSFLHDSLISISLKGR